MKIPSVFVFALVVLVTVSFNLPASALELPWEKEGGTAPSQIPGQQRPAGDGVQAPGAQTGQQTTQPVKPKPAGPPPQSARPPAGGPGPVKGSFSIAQIYVNPRFGDRGVVVSGDLSSDYQGTGGGSASGSFPGELFNGLQISAYSVSGAMLDAPQDSTGFTHTRRYKGRITGKTLTVSGSTTELYGKCNTEYGSFKFILEVKVSVNGVTKEYRSPEPCAKPAGTPQYEVKQGAGAFSVTVTAP